MKEEAAEMVDAEMWRELKDPAVTMIDRVSSETTVIHLKDQERELKIWIHRNITDKDDKSREFWLGTMKSQFKALKCLDHPHIAKGVRARIDNQQLVYTMMCEDHGVPMTSIEKLPAEMNKQLILQTLEAFAYLEQHGYQLIGATVEDVLYDARSGIFKLSEKIAEKIIPRWLPDGFYEGLAHCREEFSAPELSFYLNNCDYSFLDPKGGITGSIPTVMFRHQDVYSWAMIVYFCLTKSVCERSMKRSPEQYAGFMEGIEKCGADEAVQGLKDALKCALAFDPSQRPSFFTLSKCLRKGRDIRELMRKCCRSCGEVSEDEGCKHCKHCSNIKKFLRTPFASPFTEKMTRKFRRNPLFIINKGIGAIETSQLEAIHLSKAQTLCRSEFPESCQFTLLVELMLELLKRFVQSHEADEVGTVLEYLDRLLEMGLTQTQELFVTHLYSHILNLLIPYKPTIPLNLFTCRPEATFELRYPLENFCLSMFARAKKHADRHPTDRMLYLNLLFQLSRLQAADDVPKSLETCESVLNSLPDAKVAHVNIAQIGLCERMMEHFVYNKSYDHALRCLNRIYAITSKYLAQNDCLEHYYIFQAYLSFLVNNLSKSYSYLEKFFELPLRPGNEANRFLASYCMGSVLKNQKKHAEALTRFKAVVNLGNRGQQQLTTTACLEVCSLIIMLKLYGELAEYSAKCVEMCEKHLPQKHACALLNHYCSLRYRKQEEQANEVMLQAFKLVNNTLFKDTQTKIKILLECGNIEFRKRRFSQAYDHYYEAYGIYCDHMGRIDKRLASKVLVNLGNVSRRIKADSYDIKKNYQEARELLNPIGGKETIEAIKIWLNFATHYMEQEKPEKARQALQLAREIITANKSRPREMYSALQDLEKLVGTIKSREEGGMLLPRFEALTAEEQIVSDVVSEIQTGFRTLRPFAETVSSILDAVLLKTGDKFDLNDRVYIELKGVHQAHTLFATLGFEEEGSAIKIKEPNEKLLRYALKLMADLKYY